MSSLAMSVNEKLHPDILEPLFEDAVVIDRKNELERRVIGELDDNTIARIRRLSSVVLGQETDYFKYHVDLAEQHERFKEVTVVYSALWEVTPQSALDPVSLAEIKPGEKYAVYHPKVQPALEHKADIFDWYDMKAKIGELGEIPIIIPNIYTVQGMQELVNTGNFRDAGRRNG